MENTLDYKGNNQLIVACSEFGRGVKNSRRNALLYLVRSMSKPSTGEYGINIATMSNQCSKYLICILLGIIKEVALNIKIIEHLINKTVLYFVRKRIYI